MDYALEHVHTNNFRHMDVSPKNVMVTFSGIVKLLDFGYAKPLSGVVSENPTFIGSTRGLGTPGHMAPEAIGPL